MYGCLVSMAVYTCVLVPEEASVGVRSTAAPVTKTVVSCALGFEPGPLRSAANTELNC